MCHTSSSFIVKNNNNNNKPSRDDGKKKEPKKARASKSSSLSHFSLDDAIFAFYFLDATRTKEREISTWQRKTRVLTFSPLRLYHISEIAQRERERERVSSESKEQQQRQRSTDHVRGDERRGRDDDDELSFRRRKGLNYYYVSTSIRFEEKLCDQ